MKKLTRAAAILAGTALVGITLNTGAAHASYEPNAEYGAYWPSGLPSFVSLEDDCLITYRTVACFQADGDKFWVGDRRDDGYRSQEHWARLDQYGHPAAHGTCENRSGPGTWVVCDKDLAEGYWVEIHADSYNYSTGTDGDTLGPRQLKNVND